MKKELMCPNCNEMLTDKEGRDYMIVFGLETEFKKQHKDRIKKQKRVSNLFAFISIAIFAYGLIMMMLGINSSSIMTSDSWFGFFIVIIGILSFFFLVSIPFWDIEREWKTILDEKEFTQFHKKLFGKYTFLS